MFLICIITYILLIKIRRILKVKVCRYEKLICLRDHSQYHRKLGRGAKAVVKVSTSILQLFAEYEMGKYKGDIITFWW